MRVFDEETGSCDDGVRGLAGVEKQQLLNLCGVQSKNDAEEIPGDFRFAGERWGNMGILSINCLLNFMVILVGYFGCFCFLKQSLDWFDLR
ncbi:hypothetical protein Bsp3421_002912 [Burkholderia sp. FERM BP-3421]|uniref:hypothetical protein n=1 Tax=Burkholderia sp. FERM BP-3421 TaxID=1494466 RepID=UPI002362CB2E|nr:hypothetical protein [Burkholderia sp. FERM BP-3421]WDD92876.1 hypothetical protein Bsp3421_002912 [Burkholderia sp. FERM BP-3421]